MSVHESVLEEAIRITRGDRNIDYGEPLDDWEQIAALWTVALKDVLRPGAVVTPDRGVLMMVLLKLSREIRNPKRDNRVDGPGYFDCAQRIIEERARRGQALPHGGNGHAEPQDSAESSLTNYHP